jgi:hypothetical protein
MAETSNTPSPAHGAILHGRGRVGSGHRREGIVRGRRVLVDEHDAPGCRFAFEPHRRVAVRAVTVGDGVGEEFLYEKGEAQAAFARQPGPRASVRSS